MIWATVVSISARSDLRTGFSTLGTPVTGGRAIARKPGKLELTIESFEID
jgi:hypothetical protein